MTFVRLTLALRDMDCLVNVDHIQQVRPLARGARILWGVIVPGEEGGSHIDSDDFRESLDEIVEKLRQAQVEVLP